MSYLTEKLFPSLSYGGSNIWPMMLEVLRPIKAKLDEVQKMGLREFKSTVASCNAGWIVAVIRPECCGFLVTAKKNNAEIKSSEALKRHQDTETKWFPWDSCPDGIDDFWGATWAPEIFEKTWFRGQTTLERDIELWLASVGTEIEAAKTKVRGRVMTNIGRAFNEGRFDLITAFDEMLQKEGFR